MTDTVAPSAAPAYAVKVWMDDFNIYAEVPSLNSPAVMAFAISEGGLSKCLAVLGAKRLAEASGQQYLRPQYLSREMIKSGVTQVDVNKAAEVLRQMGLIK